jgi:hypothetical protein
MTISCARAVSLVLSQVGDAAEIAAAREHVLHCPACASTLDSGQQESRLLSRLTSLAGPRPVLALTLAVLGTLQVALALPWVFGATPLWDGGSGTAPAHLTRDGTIGLVVGLAAVSVARNARLAYFALPVCSVLSVLHVITYFSDRSRSDVAARFETVHLLTFAVTVLIAFIAFPSGRRGGKVSGRPTLV